jgi:Zn-dependent protease
MTGMTTAQTIAIWTLPVLFAITLHEVAHGWVASKFGDQTAKLSGRLTINPIKHIDLVGTIILPLLFILLNTGFIFGWAKPVPVDPRNMANPRRDMAIVSAAGPLSNLAMALIWAAIAKGGALLATGSSQWLGVPLIYMGEAGIMINIVLGVLNCLPLPPLDGGRILTCLMPPRMTWVSNFIEPYGFIILVLLMVSGILTRIISPPIAFLANGIAGVFGLV